MFPRILGLLSFLLAGGLGCHGVSAQALPEAVTQALARAKIAPEAVSVLIAETDGKAAPRLSHRAEVPMNAASVMKLVTTYAALDLLGPAFSWRTPVWLHGLVKDGTLKGNLVIQGQGDPKLVQERLWQALQRVQALGVRVIDGDIVLDHSAFAPVAASPGDFDGDPLRPYNVLPDALLFNFKAISMTFTPDAAAKLARVYYSVPLWGVQMPATVPLVGDAAGVCGDFRELLAGQFADPNRLVFNGAYPLPCGEKTWSIAYADPQSFNARNIEALWRDLGGGLTGRVRDGLAPSTSPTLVLQSPPLAELVRDINKFSSNIMANQVFLTLALPAPGVGEGDARAPAAPVTLDMARAVVQRWWQQRIGADLPLLMDNGAGLSRTSRVTARGLVKLLQVAYASPTMPELMASLPIVGLDGTLKRSRATPGSAHLKTGSLRDVMALGGYVHSADGRRLCLVALVNHPNAGAARPALDALVQWALGDNTLR